MHHYMPKQLEKLDVKSNTSQAQFGIQFAENKTYLPVQPSPELCDDPTKPWFYANESREHYQKTVEKQSYGRLIIRGNAY